MDMLLHIGDILQNLLKIKNTLRLINWDYGLCNLNILGITGTEYDPNKIRIRIAQ